MPASSMGIRSIDVSTVLKYKLIQPDLPEDRWFHVKGAAAAEPQWSHCTLQSMDRIPDLTRRLSSTLRLIRKSFHLYELLFVLGDPIRFLYSVSIAILSFMLTYFPAFPSAIILQSVFLFSLLGTRPPTLLTIFAQAIHKAFIMGQCRGFYSTAESNSWQYVPWRRFVQSWRRGNPSWAFPQPRTPT